MAIGRRGRVATTPALLIALGAAWLLGCTAARGQDPPKPDPSPVRIFINCTNTPCDDDFFRTEMTFVDHVRDRQNADVHILLTGQSTGSGGREITFDFFGQGRFMGRDLRLTERFLVAASNDDVRRGMVRVMSLGLVQYVLQTDAAQRLRITADKPAASTTAASVAHDPWNRWSLRTNINGNSNGEASSKNFSINTNVNANRTTDETKINLNTRYSFRESKYDLPDGTRFVAPNRDYGTDGLFVKSLDGHWSAGVRAFWNASTFSNIDSTWSAAPAIEWDLFPYAESTRRLLTFNYAVGARRWRYDQVTIYGKLNETRMSQALNTSVSARQRWGTIGANIEVASFMPDFAKNHVSMFGDISLNLARGFSINFDGNLEYIRDQISLPLEQATNEEVLVNQRQLATNYRYFFFFGVSYTFGSIFSPIVNPRFNGGG
jgi:hypothetical protein